MAALVARAGSHPGGGVDFEHQHWSWPAVLLEARQRASLLATFSAGPSHPRQRHVGLLLDNTPDHVFWLLACVLAGDVAVSLNTSRSSAEVADDIGHAEADLVVTETRWRPLVDGSTGPLPPLLDVDSKTFRDQLDAAPGRTCVDVPAEQTALLLFSSGSTGRPKAVIATQGRLAYLAGSMAGRLSMTADDVTYLVMPLFHGNSIMLNLLPAAATGCTVVLRRRFSASRFADDVRAYGVTYVNYVGRALAHVLTRPAEPADARGTLRLAYGTEASVADQEDFARRFGCQVQEGYGMSEGVLRINRIPGTPDGALGLPVGGADVRILDPATGQECPRAQDGGKPDSAAVGEIVAVGGAERFEGYYRNPEATAQRVRGEDFWTGDLGYRDSDGWFWFAGRGNDLVRVDGENLATGPLERTLEQLPGIAAAAVFPVADARTGDVMMCAVEPTPDKAFDPETFVDELAAAPGLGAKGWPTFVRVVDRLPTTGSGKLDKAAVRHAAWAVNDPVYYRPPRSRRFSQLDAPLRRELRAEFVRHGRAEHLPVTVRQRV